MKIKNPVPNKGRALTRGSTLLNPLRGKGIRLFTTRIEFMRDA